MSELNFEDLTPAERRWIETMHARLQELRSMTLGTYAEAVVAADLERPLTVEEWLAELPRLTEVVCVTAAENYSLERVERDGTTGPEKYAVAGLVLLEVSAGPSLR